MRWIVVSAMAILCGASPARGAPDGTEAWKAVIDRLASALAERQDDSAALSVIGDRCRLTRLDGQEIPTSELLARTGGVTWRLALAYSRVPDELASDLAAALASSPPTQALKAYLLTSDETQRRRADALAVKWIAAALQPRAQQSIGVILLYREAPAAQRAGTLLVVLAAGQQSGPREYALTQIAFGEFAVPAR